jgi:hypothetical protein
MRQRAIAFVLSLAFGLVPAAAMAATAFVQDDHTPIVSKPGVGGKVLRWVDSGFALNVVARKGEWLKVEARRLDPPVAEAWIPAARVGPVAPGTESASAADETGDADFRLEVSGPPGVDFRARCYILDAAGGRTVVVRQQTPAVFEIPGDAVACAVANIDNGSFVQTALLDADGAVVASSDSVKADRAVTLRSDGPWGAAGRFDAPLQFVAFRDLRNRHHFVPLPPIIDPSSPVTGNPVPPLGNPVPAMGNPVPAMGNPVPAMGNPVPAFSSSPTPPLRGRSTPPLGGTMMPAIRPMQ